MDDAETWNAVPADPLPIQEDAPVHAEFPPEVQWDNVRLERELKGLEVPVTILRPGMIYGLDDPLAREWPLVRRVRQGIRRLELPDGGTQFASRVSVDLVADAIVKALERAPSTWWACNVVDPYGWTYAGLAGQVAKVLDWVWEPVPVAFHEARHPFLARHPLVMADDRLRTVLGAEGPDPAAALAELIRALYRDGPRSGALYDAEPYF